MSSNSPDFKVPVPTPRDMRHRLGVIKGEAGKLPRSVRPADGERPRFFKDMFIGRPVTSRLTKLPAEVKRTLDREQAAFHPDGAGLVYIKGVQMEKFAARSVLNRAIIAEEITHLDTSYDAVLEINRGEVSLQTSPLHNPTLQTYHVLAPVLRAYKDGEVVQDLRTERAQLETFFGVKETIWSTEIWLGYLNMPIGNGAEQDIAASLDEVLPDSFTVDAVQLYARQPKQ